MELNLLHLALEVSVTACLFFLSWINVSSADYGRYSVILAMGAAFAGFANLIHIGAAILLPSIEYFSATMVGSSSQFVLLFMFTLIGICSKKNHCATWILVTALTIPIIGSIIIDAYQYTYGQLSIFHHITVIGVDIYYPFYLLCAVLWGGVAYLVSNKRNYLFPPYTSTIFFTYAVVANVMVAFISPENIEMCNMLAHALKLTGYYTVILMYLISKYRFESSGRINTNTDHSTPLTRI